MRRLLRPIQILTNRPTRFVATPLRSRFINSSNPMASAPKAAETDTQAQATANATGVTPDSISQRLKEQISAAHVEIEDMSGGCGQSFHAVIVSPLFDKKTTIARHRLVNTALKSEIAAIHAWTPRCFTPEEWEKKSAA